MFRDRPVERVSDRIGVCTGCGDAPLSPDIAQVLNRVAISLGETGIAIVPCKMPEAQLDYDAFATILLAEALAEHRKRNLIPDRRLEYGEDVQVRIRMAEQIQPRVLAAALARRADVVRTWSARFEKVDLVLTAVSAGPPARIGEEPVCHLGSDMEFRRLMMPLIAQQSMAGLPACSVRAGFDNWGLPVNVQITGPQNSDALVLQAAAVISDLTHDAQQHWPPDPIRHTEACPCCSS